MSDYGENKASDFGLNVRQFGAVGDGETDDTRAIQEAINAAADISGQVIFPPGIYACTTLYLKPPTTQSWGVRSVWFRDPDGNLVNFYAREASDDSSRQG